MLVYDLSNPQELLGFVRNIPIPTFTLNTYLPDDMLDDVEYRYTRDDTVDQDVAPYRGWDVEAAIGNRMGLSRIMGEIPPLSKKIRLGEEQRLRLNSLRLGGDTTTLVNRIFDDAGNMARAVQARIEQARGRALYDGKFVASENGFIQTIDYGIPGTHRVAPGILWSTFATATPVDDMRTWLDLYVADNGFPPGLILTSTAVVSNLLRNAQIRTLASSLAGGPSIVSRAVLNATLSDYELPPIVTYDVSVRVAGVLTKVIPTNRAIFLPPAGMGLGRTFWGVTAEALELAGAGQIVASQAPGLVAVVDKTFDPVATWTKAAAVSMPVIANPKQILVATVQ